MQTLIDHNSDRGKLKGIKMFFLAMPTDGSEKMKVLDVGLITEATELEELERYGSRGMLGTPGDIVPERIQSFEDSFDTTFRINPPGRDGAGVPVCRVDSSGLGLDYSGFCSRR